MCSRGVSAFVGTNREESTCRCPQLWFATVRSHVLPIEHVSDYIIEHTGECASSGKDPDDDHHHPRRSHLPRRPSRAAASGPAPPATDPPPERGTAVVPRQRCADV